MLSVISVVSNDKTANQYLLAGLREQDAEHELVIVDNTQGAFRSAAQALNYGAAKAQGDYLLFVHQDVLFPDRGWLRQVEQQLSAVPSLGIAGVAGMVKPRLISQFEVVARYHLARKLHLYPRWFRSYGRGMVFQGPNKQPWKGEAVKEPCPVQTLDELVLIVPAAVFSSLKFDEVTCDDWHLYGVDYALSAAEKGLGVYVLPCPTVHASTGKKSKGYFQTLPRVAEKHRGARVINTTMGLWATSPRLLKYQLRLMGDSRRLQGSF